MNSATIYCDNCGAANRIQATFCIGCGERIPRASPLPQTASINRNINYSIASSMQEMLPSNHLLNRRYRVIEPVGKGGMGIVYKAADSLLGDRAVAIKEMGQSGLTTQEITEAAAAFKREALILASLKHPSLPSIYDHFNEDARWYLVMDFIEGETVEDYLRKANGQKLSVNEVLRIGEQLCQVLDYLHTHQPPIIFRDLKPANIMINATKHLYLIDFGIARLFKPGQSKDTTSLGSLGYAAPEQYGKAQTTVRSDIYSLGATLHQMLTGIDPSITPFTFSSIQSHNPQTPPVLEKIIMMMVDMDVNKRPSSVSKVMPLLQQIITLLSRNVTSQYRPLRSESISHSVSTTPIPAKVQTSLTAPPQQFRGQSQQVSKKFTLNDGLVVFRMTHNGKRNFIVVLLDDKGTQIATLVNRIGNFNGANAIGVKQSGTYLLKITADGNWTINVETQQVKSATAATPKMFKGTGQQVTPLLKLSNGLTTFRMTHDGKRNFIVVLLDDKGTQIATLVNRIGNFNGANAIGVKQSGTYLLNITADGNWTINVEQ